MPGTNVLFLVYSSCVGSIGEKHIYVRFADDINNLYNGGGDDDNDNYIALIYTKKQWIDLLKKVMLGLI